MANQYGLFWNSQSQDRTYDADSFSELFQKFFTNGVFNGDLQVTASSGMDVSVGAGYCCINGKVRFFDTATTLTVSPASGTYPRIDTIVIERNDTNREITLKYVTGAYSGDSPVATAPVRAGGVYQIVLAEIYVGVGVTAITQGAITDKRADTSVCGWVVGTVDAVDVEQMTAQAQADFDAWYQEMKDQLSEDAAGHLQNEITWEIVDLTLASANWSNSQYVISNANFTLDKVKVITTPLTVTTTQYDALSLADIRAVSETTGSITLQAFGAVPSIDVPIQVQVAGGIVIV